MKRPVHSNLQLRARRAAASLWRLLRRAVRRFREDRGPQLAAAIAYHTVFALFPLAVVAAGMGGLVLRTTEVRDGVVDAIVRELPLSDGGRTALRDQLLQATGALSGLGALGLLGLIWAASGVMAAIRAALNEAWKVDQGRSFVRGKLFDVGFVFCLAAIFLASFGLTVVVRVAARAADGGPHFGGGWVGWLLSVAVPAGAAFGAVTLLYRFVPATSVQIRDVWPAALGVAALLVLAQNLFALYVSHLADYDVIYGSLGAVIAFMVFVYWSSMLLIVGAEVASDGPRTRREARRTEGEDRATRPSRQPAEPV